MMWPYCFNVLDSNVLFTERKLTLLKRYIERITFKKHLTVKTVENGQFVAKKFGIDWPDHVLQYGEGRSSVKLKTLPALQALSN